MMKIIGIRILSLKLNLKSYQAFHFGIKKDKKNIRYLKKVQEQDVIFFTFYIHVQHFSNLEENNKVFPKRFVSFIKKQSDSFRLSRCTRTAYTTEYTNFILI